MPVRTRALLAALLSAAFVVELPSAGTGSTIPAALGASGGARAAVIVSAVRPMRIEVQEPLRVKPLTRPANAIRPKLVQGVRPLSSRRVGGPPMLRPSEFGHVVEAARRALSAHVQPAVHVQSLPLPARPMPIATRSPARVLIPQAVQNCNPTLAVVRKPQTVVTSPTPDPVTPTPCPPTVTPVPQPTPTPVPTGTATPAALASSGTGINPWWRYQEENVPGGGHVMVNVGTGNMLLQDDDMSVPHKGIALAFRRTYNSQSRHDVNASDGAGLLWEPPGMYGNGWTNTFDAHLARTFGNVYSVFDIDGARYDYTQTISNGVATYTPTPGNHNILTWDGTCGMLWTKKSGTTYYFYRPNPVPSCGALSVTGGFAGRLYQIVGRNHNTSITFAYAWDNNDASASGKIAGITATTESGQAATLSFADFNGHRLLQQLTYPDGATTVTYGYDGFGNLSSVSSPPNNSAGNRPQHWYGYNQSGSDYVMSYASSPRWAAACNVDNCGGDGAYLGFAFAGTGAASSTLSSIQHFVLVNPTISDGTGGLPIQAGYPTYAYAYLTEYYTTGVAMPTLRDTDGHMMNWAADGAGRPTQTQECTASTGQGTQCSGTWLFTNETWDADNNLTAEVDARGYETDYAFDANGNTIAAANPLTTTAQGTFRPTSLYSYDVYNNVTAYCDPAATHQLGADWTAVPPSSDTLCPQSTVARQFIWSNPPTGTPASPSPSYEPFGELLAIVWPATASLQNGYRQTFSYDLAPQVGNDYGLVTRVTGAPISQPSDAATPTRTPSRALWYDVNGNLVCYGTGGGSWILTYDALGRLTSSADPDDAASGTGSCAKSGAQPNWNTTATTSYFPDGSVASAQSPLARAVNNVATTFTYDIDGNESTETDHYGCVSGQTCTPGVKQRWYDGEDRLVEVALPRDNTDLSAYGWLTRYAYDLSGTGGPAPGINGAAVSAYGNLFKTAEFLPPTVNGHNTDISGTPSWVDVRGTSFDAMDRAVASIEVAFGNVPKLTRTYDGNGQLGQLSRTVNANGQTRDIDYDPLGRIQHETYSGDNGLTPNRSFTYDVSDGVSTIASDLGTQRFTYDAAGRMATMTEPSGGNVDSPATISYAYYGDGKRSATTISSAAFPLPVSLAYGYRADGMTDFRSYADSWATYPFSWQYTGAGRMLQRTDPLTGVSAAGRTIVPETLQYDATGQLQSLTLPRNGTMSAVTHDAEGEIVSFSGYQAAASSLVRVETRRYTVRGELQTRNICLSDGTHCAIPSVVRYYNGAPGGDLRSGQSYGNQTTADTKAISYSYDTAGRQTGSISKYNASTSFQQNWVAVPYTRVFDAEDHVRSHTVAQASGVYGYATSVAPCNGMPNTMASSASASYWPDLHAAVWHDSGDATDEEGGAVNETLHWDGDELLFVSSPNGGGASTTSSVYVGTEGAFTRNPGTGSGPTEIDVYDRDFGGAMVSSHWSHLGYGYGGWGTGMVQPTPCSREQTTSDYPVPSSLADTNPYPPVGLGAARVMPKRTDGYDMGVLTLQGVRTFDQYTGQWTAPDAYEGQVDDPMSQKPFMWNRNNPYEYADPSGFDAEPTATDDGSVYYISKSPPKHPPKRPKPPKPEEPPKPQRTIPPDMLQKIAGPPSGPGRPPMGNDGHPMEAHHVDQKPGGEMKGMTRTEHRGKGNFTKNHSNTGGQRSQITPAQRRQDNKNFWQSFWDALQKLFPTDYDI